jgi:hypothetical protein
VVGAHYGLKQSNHIYDQDFIQLLVNAGFTQCPSHPYTFVKWSIPGQFTPPSHPLTVSMHVDDGDGCTTSPAMYTAFQNHQNRPIRPIAVPQPITRNLWPSPTP